MGKVLYLPPRLIARCTRDEGAAYAVDPFDSLRESWDDAITSDGRSRFGTPRFADRPDDPMRFGKLDMAVCAFVAALIGWMLGGGWLP